jgi:50S ribosomal subunit-associated GTPase HflX
VHYAHSEAIVFLVDSSDRERLQEARDALEVLDEQGCSAS